MAKVVLVPQAVEDLERLAEFVDQEPAAGGSDGIEAIVEALGVLRAHPLLGRRIDRTLRELVISRGKAGYLATYRFDPVRDLVRVLRIRHQREAGYLD